MDDTHRVFETHIQKAGVLIEALPYLQRFRGCTFVIKVGGSAMENDGLVRELLRDVVFMEVAGINPVIVHGGGKFISAAMAERGLEPRFVNGLRVTDDESIRLVEETLSGKINPGLVEMIEHYGGRAVGIPGSEVFVGERTFSKGPDGEQIDLGHVGRVIDFQIDRVMEAIQEERVPVLSPLARNAANDDLPLNINADLAAAALASRLKATKLVFLSDVLGVLRERDKPETLIHTIDEHGAEELIADGTIAGGMIPKVRSSVEALHAGVEKVHMVDGRIPHSLLIEVFTDQGVGTEFLPAKS